MENKQQLIIDFKQTFGSEHGKRVLAHLKSVCKCNPGQSCFDGQNPNQTAYNLGASWVPSYIQTLIDAKVSEEIKDCITEPEQEK
jgi:hypothetical protein